jgi:16S rRNA (adenine1518-N6/adenine1519-N6)-dimethyltransferase
VRARRPAAPRPAGDHGRRRRLGQHFLADPDVADRIVLAVGAGPRDLVVDVGAGEGVLTRRLVGRAGRVVALEIDAALVARLRGLAGVDVREADARTFAYERLLGQRPDPTGRLLVVGNLPYSASKPILRQLLRARPAIDRAVLMLQHEVADRLVAAPGGRAYGLLSVAWRLWADVELLFSVPPTAFRPPPAVDSAVIRATFRPAPRVPLPDEAVFLRIARAAFGSRRKTLVNALAAGGVDARAIQGALGHAGIEGRRRGETLDLEELARLAQFFVGREGA